MRVFLSNNNVSAQAHARNIAELTNEMEDSMAESSSSSNIAQIYESEQRNSTVLALVIANLVDEVLRKYRTAFDIDYDLTNMSNMDGMRMSNISGGSSSHFMNMTNTAVTSNISSDSDTSGRDLNLSRMMGNDLRLINIHDYETAQVLADNVDRLFGDDLRPQSLVGETINIDTLENNLSQLKHAIEIKASPEYLMEIVHIQIHPMLQRVYDLKLFDTRVIESAD